METQYSGTAPHPAQVHARIAPIAIALIGGEPMVLQSYKMLIDGEWEDAESGATFDVINPATEEPIAKVAKGGREEVDAAIDAARTAFDSGAWSKKTPAERSVILWRMAELVEKQLVQLAELESKNVGKTIKYSRDSDMPFVIDNLRFFAGAARNLEGKSVANFSGMGLSMIKREPIGVVGAIVPWNYPLYIAIWKIAPALAAGNTLVIKPASYTPLTLLEFAKAVNKLLPKGVLNVVAGPGDIVGSGLAMSKKVDMVALTGDIATGKNIMQSASINIKRVHLELGGKAPLVVLPDASLEAATEGAVVSAFWNSAQDCTATTRVYVHEKSYKKFVSALARKAARIRIGDPMSEKTDMGPLISAKQRDRTQEYVRSGMDQGAKLVFGGKRPAKLKRGFFFEPTIFSDVDQGMRICQEEIFGPVLSVMSYRTIDEAVEKANDVIYGLAASVWGSDITKTMDVASRLRFGTVWINEHGVLASEMPHGGYKQSGFGKDLSAYAFEDFTQIKHIYIDQTGMARKPWYYVVYGDKE